MASNKPAPLDEAIRSELMAVMKKMGERKAVAYFGIPRSTALRGLAGLDLREGSRLLIAQRLKEGRTAA